MNMIMNLPLIKRENYPHQFGELPLSFVGITVAIFANYPRHPLKYAFGHTRRHIEFHMDMIYFIFTMRLHVHKSKIMFPYQWLHNSRSHELLWLIHVH